MSVVEKLKAIFDSQVGLTAQQRADLMAVAIGSSKSNNYFIDPLMRFWQVDTSFTNVASGQYCPDMYVYYKNGTMVHTISRSTDVPTELEAGHKIPYSMKIDCTADAIIGSGNYCFISQPIEGYRFEPLKTKPATLSFFIKSPIAGIHCFVFRNSGFDRSHIIEFEVDVANIWQKIKLNLYFDYSGGAWNYLNGLGLIGSIILAAGSTYHTDPNEWQTGNYLSTSNQVNLTDNTGYDLYITEFILNEGLIAIPYTPIDFGAELFTIQRYFEKSYDINTNPGTATVIGCRFVPGGRNTAGQGLGDNFKVPKRISPITIPYSIAGTINAVTNNGDRAGNVIDISERGFQHVSITGGSAPYHLKYQWTADSRLY